MYYILKEHEHEPVRVTFNEWRASFKAIVVKKTDIGDVHISTVFLGMDHSFFDGPPILFETMIFGGEHKDFQARYATWDEAEVGHQKAVDMVEKIQSRKS